MSNVQSPMSNSNVNVQSPRSKVQCLDFGETVKTLEVDYSLEIGRWTLDIGVWTLEERGNLSLGSESNVTE
jgi:hypothetical protein